jgi:hypothetical protein
LPGCTLIALIGFVIPLIGVFDGLLEAPVFSHLGLRRIADGTMPAPPRRRRSELKDRRKLHNALAFAPAFAVL